MDNNLKFNIDTNNLSTIKINSIESIEPSSAIAYFDSLPSIALPTLDVSNKLDDLLTSINNIQNISYNFALPWEEQNIFTKEETKKKTQEALLRKSVNSFASHISDDARKFLRNNKANIDLELFNKKSNMAVLSVDIRGSTHLMEKAVSEEAFGYFLAKLTESFKQIVLSNYGIYDKFTGDGVICYFPEFYSGKDYLYFAIKTSQELHRAFKTVYQNCADCFKIIIKNAGLGIGIDSGSVLLKMIADDITIIGNPVIDACRLNGAPAYNTYVNNQAYHQILNKYRNSFLLTEQDYEYKHEGTILVHKIEFVENENFIPERPVRSRMLKQKEE